MKENWNFDAREEIENSEREGEKSREREKVKEKEIKWVACQWNINTHSFESHTHWVRNTYDRSKSVVSRHG